MVAPIAVFGREPSNLPAARAGMFQDFVLKRADGGSMPESYTESALRHSMGADCLAAFGQLDSAGYMIGYAVECAIKSAIQATRPTAQAPHVHLPKLVEGARKALQGRRSTSICQVLGQANFMRGWEIGLRYTENGTVCAERFKCWRTDANRVLSAANLRRRP